MSHPLTLFVTVCVTRLCSYQVKHSVMTLAWPRGRRPLPVLPALIGQWRHSADPGLVTIPCHWPHSASCPALGPASTASHSQQPQQPPGAGRASLHSLTEATLGKYFSQKKSFIFSSGHVSPMLNDSYLILAASMLSNGKQQ